MLISGDIFDCQEYSSMTSNLFVITMCMVVGCLIMPRFLVMIWLSVQV